MIKKQITCLSITLYGHSDDRRNLKSRTTSKFSIKNPGYFSIQHFCPSPPLFGVIIFIFCLCNNICFAQNQGTQDNRTKNYNLEQGVAIEGYDPVSYFSGKPKKGKKDFSYSYQGVTYYFLDQKNKEEFISNAPKYEPAYGGWCAYAMGNSGEKVEVDPKTYKIIDGRLYLFYNQFFTNTLESWNKDETGLKKKADNNWKKIYK